MRFSINVNQAELPATMRRVIRIVGWKIFKKRIENLKSLSGKNPYWDSFLRDRHGLEMAFGKVHQHLQAHGQCPWPPRNAEEYWLYTFVNAADKVYQNLNERGRKRFSGDFRSALQGESGLGPLAFEMRTVVHLAGRGFDVECHDREMDGGVDFLASRDGTSVEVECKHVSADIGRKIHRRTLHDFGGIVHPTLSQAVDQRGGRLVRVTLPGCLKNANEQKQAIAERIAAVLTGEKSEIRDSVCQVSAEEFPLTGSPFSAGRGHALKLADIDEFLKNTFGIENTEVLSYWRPGHGAVLVHMRSEKPDGVIDAIFDTLKKSAKGQFTGDLPGLLCVHLADLRGEQLLDLYNTGRSGIPTRFSERVKKLFEDRPHLYGLVLTADGDVHLTEEQNNGHVVTTAVQESGPTWVFKNPAHPRSGTKVLDDLFGMGDSLRP